MNKQEQQESKYRNREEYVHLLSERGQKFFFKKENLTEDKDAQRSKERGRKPQFEGPEYGTKSKDAKESRKTGSKLRREDEKKRKSKKPTSKRRKPARRGDVPGDEEGSGDDQRIININSGNLSSFHDHCSKKSKARQH